MTETLMTISNKNIQKPNSKCYMYNAKCSILN